ncbi:fasciclin-like arabinogalactan protein 12 [Cornus florida]|uniref:fasciclin-like arabinogalactan protein 12 n=1 Tax=Cornus florida TaxID=4283 RepID=UPI0028A13667|nr:fasciclin-like arabinogalactan protein 12 [Cornus florida]
MMKRILFSLSLTLLFHLHFSTTLALSPAPTAAPLGATTSPNIIKILEKDGHFTLFVRLLKSTHVGDQINDQLKNSNNGLTVFAPVDTAFSSLTSGTINSLNDRQQVELIQYHFVLSYISATLFQTMSNPLRTQAGDTGPGQFPLNVTISGNLVKLSTGIINTTVSGTIYTDNQLAVYQVDSVLLPSKIFGSQALKTTPATTVDTPTSSSSDSDDSAKPVASGAVSLTMHGMVVTIGVAVVESFLL